MNVLYWAQHRAKNGNLLHSETGETREEAARRLFEARPTCVEAMTGKGTNGPSFDIRWIKRQA